MPGQFGGRFTDTPFTLAHVHILMLEDIKF